MSEKNEALRLAAELDWRMAGCPAGGRGMTDRELLELAAKAAELQVVWHETDDEPWCFIPDCHPPHNRRQRDKWSGTVWNPLTDDGDALRLAVKLDLSSLMVFSYPGSDKRREFWSPNSGTDGGRSATTEADYTADPYAATRRAITRAAAEIGKGMK